MGNSTPIHDDRKLGALTGIRFAAAGAVLLSHYTQLGLIDFPEEIVRFLDGGRPAVALFFVLSGFILAFNYYDLDGGIGRRSFWVARFARLYPNVLLAMAIAIPSVAIALADPSHEYLLRWFALDGNYSLGLTVSAAAQLTMTTAWLPVASFNQPWNSPAWSIGCEMFFYALFPFLIIWMRRMRVRGLAALVAVGFVGQGLMIASIRELVPPDRAGFLISQFPVTHLFGFVAGIAVARIFLEYRQALSQRRWVRDVLLWGGWFGVTLIGIFRPVEPVYFLMAPLFALVVLALALPRRRGRSWLGLPLFLVLGEASYALYMTHIPIGHLLQHAGISGMWSWLAVVAVIGLSVVILRLWETPARIFLRNRLDARPPARGDSKRPPTVGEGR